MVEATKSAKVEPNDPASWNGHALVTTLQTGPTTVVPIASVAAGDQSVNRSNSDTKDGKAFVIGTPPVNWTVLPLVESNGPIVIIPVGTSPYNNGVVVLFQ